MRQGQRDGTAEGLGLLVMLSGRGRTLANLLEACRSGVLAGRAEVRLVVASGPCAGVEVATRAGVEARVIAGTVPGDALAAMARERGCSLVILAGYLRRVEIAEELRGRVLNIHPALLTHGDTDAERRALIARGWTPPRVSLGGPGFYGERVHQAVLDCGATLSGCTVHLCDAAYDSGSILLRRTCPVEPGDTAQSLAARVFAEECVAYPEAIARAAGAGSDADNRRNPDAAGASNA